jgi:hypothetical protein
MTDIQSFWESVYIAALDQAKDKYPEVPWNVTAAATADYAVALWNESLTGDDPQQ